MLFLAIHNGHGISESVSAKIGLSNVARMREEDPFTDRFIRDKDNHVVQLTSRFEYDLNRSRERAVYQKPSDCWELPIYPEDSLSNCEIDVALEKYDKFYRDLDTIIESFISKHNKIIIWDIHSYNHRRNGQNSDFDNNDENPEIILGTNDYKYMSKDWKPLIDKIEHSLKSQAFHGEFKNRSISRDSLDVRQNVKFPGGYLSQHINRKYPDNACCIAVEFKKIWMDEWSQEIDEACLSLLKDVFNNTCDDIRNTLESK